MFLLDTNICIYLMKNAYPSMTERILSVDPSEFYVSAITVFELEYGASKSNWGDRTKDNMRSFLSPFSILPFDVSDAIVAGQLRSYLAQAGTPIGPYDLQISAQALTRDLTVITHNLSEFSRVPNLKTEDWV